MPTGAGRQTAKFGKQLLTLATMSQPFELGSIEPFVRNLGGRRQLDTGIFIASQQGEATRRARSQRLDDTRTLSTKSCSNANVPGAAERAKSVDLLVVFVEHGHRALDLREIEGFDGLTQFQQCVEEPFGFSRIDITAP